MVERDARWIARQMADRLQTTFEEPEIKQLLVLTGRLPAFMKLACRVLVEGGISPGQSIKTWTEHLLARPEFQRNCQEIWDDLWPEEQHVLLALSAGASETSLESAAVAYLEETGLLVRETPGSAAAFFSPIFARFVASRHKIASGLLELEAKTGEIRRGGLPLHVELTVHEDRLLAYFLAHAGEICDKDDLMGAVWPDERYDVGDERLAQLVKRLRDKIEPTPSHPVYLQTVRGRGYRLVQPGQS
jgi:DNA-binding winged helix-turn-helix (wHTH) protein